MTPAQLKATLPALRSVTDEVIAAKILLADLWFDEAAWGDFYAEGLANWVANELVLDGSALTTDDGIEVSHSAGGRS